MKFHLSASRIKNFLHHDTILDWLSLYGKQNGHLPSSSPQPMHQWICQRGILWETQDTQTLIQWAQKNHFSYKYYSITPHNEQEWEDSSHAALQDLQSNQFDILIQVPLQAPSPFRPNECNWRGIIDLLLSPKVIQNLSSFEPPFPAGDTPPYFIADWKQNRVILTKERELPYRHPYRDWYYQCWIYKTILQQLHIPVVDDSFGILPMSLRFSSRHSTPLRGGILHHGVTSFFYDEQEDLMRRAEDWLSTLHQPETASWNPLTHPQLSWNCKNPHAEHHPFAQARTLLARMRGEITLLPYVSYDRKRKAEEALLGTHNEHEVLTISHPLLSSSHFLNPTANPDAPLSKRIHKGLQVMRRRTNPQAIPANGTSWTEAIQQILQLEPRPPMNWIQHPPGGHDEWVCVDFEFLPVSFLSLSAQETIWKRKEGMILTCWGYAQWKNGECHTEQYILDEPTPEGESRLWNQFASVIGDTFQNRWISWGHAEQSVFQGARNLASPHALLRSVENPVNLMRELERLEFLPYPLLTYKLKDWGRWLIQEREIPPGFPSITQNLQLPPAGEFWIPDWVPYLEHQVSTRPPTNEFRQYHLRDITWLLAIWKRIGDSFAITHSHTDDDAPALPDSPDSDV